MKDKKMIILIVVIVLLVFGLSFARSRGPRPIDWSPTFINIKTDPYGTYITYQLLSDIFEKKKIRSTRMPIYNNLKNNVGEYLLYEEDSPTYDREYYDTYEESPETDTEYTESEPQTSDIIANEDYDPSEWYNELDNISDTTSYLFINSRFSLDKLDMEYMLDFVGLGNNVFISAEVMDRKLLDTLKIKTNIQYFQTDTVYTLKDYQTERYRFKNVQGQTKFNTDSCKLPVRVLATNKKNDTVFIDVKYGKGHIYLHSIPSAFANINMLQNEKYDFGFRCLSYLPQNSNIIWDEYQKQGMIGEGSDLQVILNNPALRTALYVILCGFLLFMLFRSKRIQRAIPIINPPVNSSLEFLGTISNLYYRKKDFSTILQKRHAFFLDYIRKSYYMSTENIDNEFVNVLSAKSGMDKDKLSELFLVYKDLSTLAFIEIQPFLRYNNLLEEFYRTVKNK
ncbi:DUF4350 domain-containing protein [Prevotella sp. 10(H)]|uniref:DUF4350 domain-containing protein n=1 Tax=Prevotella sp. 10(H) TaxID=1158294 RepID=UPI0004A72A82|nr:DUF4350 domain-containing protein [Prevotella sp. 10(H)]